MRHQLKCQPEYFTNVWYGMKTFEIRNNDRNFKVGDEIVLVEHEGYTAHEGYTGREIEAYITYLTNFEQQSGYVVFSFKETKRKE